MKQLPGKARSRINRAGSVGLTALALVAACEQAGALAPSEVLSRIAGVRFFVTPDSPAARQAAAWRSSRPVDAALMDRIAAQPTAQWLGNWNSDVRRDVSAAVTRAQSLGRMALFVAYNIPYRDCGSYSAGGAGSADQYRGWIRSLAEGLGGRHAVVVVEPDAVAGASCLSAARQDERFSLLRDAVRELHGAGAVVYLDAGHAQWMSAATAADRLARAGIADADGFALNVSNYLSTAANVAYGETVSARVGGKHFIVDTGRNGAGGDTNGQWCNPSGQALGVEPTTQTGNRLVDAYLWIKVPGESDGTCNGGPAAGQFWADYALGLARQQQMLASR